MPSKVYRKSGEKYRGYVAVIYRPTMPKETYEGSKTFNTGDPDADKAAAEAYREACDTDLRRDRFVAPKGGNIAFRDRREFWIANRRVGESTIARDESYFRNHIEPYFDDLPLRQVNEYDRITRWITMLTEEKELAPATVHKAHGLVSAILKQCVLAELIGKNICVATAKTLPPIDIKEMMALNEEEEIPALLAAIAALNPRYCLPVKLDAYTGLRVGELFGLQVQHLDFDTDQVLVRQQLTEVQGRLAIKPKLKTKAGRREVLVPASIMAELRDHVAGKAPGDFVFTDPGGGPVRVAGFRSRIFQPAAVAAGLSSFEPCTAGDPDPLGRPSRCEICNKDNPESKASGHYHGLRIHDLRHTAVTIMIDHERHLSDIARMIGQVSTRLIDERYGHDPRRNRKVKLDRAQHRINASLAAIEAAGRAPVVANVTPLRPRQRRSA